MTTRAAPSAGNPIAVEILDHTGHGLLLFGEEDGKRRRTGYHLDYFRRMVDSWQTQLPDD